MEEGEVVVVAVMEEVVAVMEEVVEVMEEVMVEVMEEVMEAEDMEDTEDIGEITVEQGVVGA